MTWVNYQHGVNLAEAIEPGSSKRMTRDELIAYPAKISAESVTPEQGLVLAGARVGPALEWAVANGILAQQASYTRDEIHTALSTLDQHLVEMEKAVKNLVTPSPMRKDYFTHSEMHTALVIKDKSEQYKKYPVPVYDEKKFNADFTSDLKSKKTAYGTLIKHLISTLPTDERNAIEHGRVGLYALAPAGPETEPERDVFVMRVVHNGKTTVYTVNPQRGEITQRNDYRSLFTGAGVIGRKKREDGSEEDKFTLWSRPNIQESRYRPKAEKQNNEQPNNEPFNSAIYTLNPLGELTKSAENESEHSAPKTLSSQRSNAIADVISNKLFYVNEDDFLSLAEDDPERVTEQETKDRAHIKSRKGFLGVLKGFVPFWHGIELLVAGRTIEGVSQIWIDILSSMLPVEDVLGGLVKGAARLVKSTLPAFSKLTKNFTSFSPKPGVAGVKWEGGVQGLKWSQSTTAQASKGIEQFRVNAAPIPKADAAVREIEWGGAKYFVADKPDAGDGMHYVLRVTDPDNPAQLVSSGKIAKPDNAGMWQKHTSTDEGVQSAAFTQMGGPMNELGVLGGELHTFTDTYKGGTRLNVVAHGIERSAADVRKGVPSRVIVGDKAYTATEFVAYLRTQGIDPADSRYGNVRLLICYAAEGGEHSFAREFQRAVGKPIKAFEGTVTMSHGATNLEYVRATLEVDLRAQHPGLDQAGIDLLVASKIETLFKGKPVYVNKADGTLVQIQSAPQGAQIGEHLLRVEYKPAHFKP